MITVSDPIAHATLLAKLSPEPQPGSLIPRVRLYERLEIGTRRRATILTAAAGYGKTGLLSSYVSSIGWPTIWYRLDQDDVDPARFLFYLAEGFRQSLPHLTRIEHGVELIDQSAGTHQASLAALIAALAGPGYCQSALVLDGFEAVSHSPEIAEILDYLLAYLPAECHLFVSSRRDIATAQLARLRQYGQVLDLTEADMAFTDEETRDLLRERGLHGLSGDSLAQIAERAQGWAAALQMLCQRLVGRGDDFDGELLEMRGVEPPISDYLAFHFLETQPPATQRFMEMTAHLFQLTPGAADNLLESADAGTMLDRLSRGHSQLFYQGLQGDEPVYRYHPLFQDFLQARLRRREGKNAIRALHKDCGQIFENEENWEAAFHHYCQGQHWRSASRIIRLQATRLIGAGEVATIRDWLSRIPETVLEKDPWLLVHRSGVLRLEDKLQPASVILERAERLFRQQKESDGIARTMLERTTIAFESRKPAEALRLLEEALSVVPKGGHNLRAEIHTHLILGYATCGRFVEAADSFDKAMSLLERADNHRASLVLRARATRRLAWVQLQQGRIRSALQMAEQAYQLCQTESLGERTTVHCLDLMALIHATKGDFEEALPLLDRAMEIAARRGLIKLLNKLTWAKSSITFASNDFAAARAVSAFADDDSADTGGLGYVWLRQGRLSEARQLCFREMEDAEQRGAPIDLACARAVLGVVALESGNVDEAEQYLSNAVGLFDRLRLEYRLAGVRLHLARLCYDQSEFVRGRRHLLEALHFAEREQCFNFFLWQPDAVALLAAEALRENLARNYVLKLCVRRLTLAQLRFFLPLLSESDAGLRELATRLILDLAGSNAQHPGAADPLLSTCKDDDLRARIVSALADQRLTVAGILRLRHAYGLTWREIDIFARYYLPLRNTEEKSGSWSESHRANLARSMCITDNTLRYHVSSIRRKLKLFGRKGGISVYQWALGEGIIGQFTEFQAS
ncbi:MAG: hypothetical protein HYY30_14300 [Chloroflexi bacterium]|nr:hypothetical protein [Chloroflexota bacterium]